MNYLIIDTTLKDIGIVISSHDKHIASAYTVDAKKHNAYLLELLDTVFIENGITINDIDVFGVVNGVGSFTGIRVGVATVNAFARALGKKVIEINNLEAALFGVGEKEALALLDCKHNNFYAAHTMNGEIKYLFLSQSEADEYTCEKRYVTDSDLSSAEKLFIEKAEKGQFVNAVRPFYLKESSAEIEKSEKKELKISLVLMAERHLSQIAELEKQCFGVMAWSEKLIAEELLQQNKHYFVALDGDKVIGYCGYAHILTEAHIMNIAVDGNYRRRSVGKTLLECLLNDAVGRNITSATLEVRENNAPAIALYEKYGFQRAGLRPRYYPDGEGAYIYWVNIE